jgi:succinoglycan biosynthesis protein ExoV
MEIIYYQSPAGNFGDDLNTIIWRELLPPSCFEADDSVLLGIGSIFRDEFLTEQATRNKRVFVLGSGAGTGPLPKLWPNKGWSVLAMRGPLSAKLIGRPETTATDGAALLATTPQLLPPRTPRDVVFFPHYNSIALSRWQEACELADLVFVDPHWPPQKVLRALGRARLVVTEAMHGAIVADALRIPWVPVVSSPAIPPFKWIDWTRSLDLEYQPITLPPSSGWEVVKHRKIRLAEPQEFHRSAADGDDTDELIRDFHERYGAAVVHTPAAPRKAKGSLRSVVQKKPIRSVVQKASRVLDPVTLPRAAQALRAASRSRAFLSDERILADRIARLQDAVGTLRRALAA